MSELAELENSIEYIVWLIDNRVEKVRAIEKQMSIWVIMSSVLIALLSTLGILIIFDFFSVGFIGAFVLLIFILQIPLLVLFIVSTTKMKISNELNIGNNDLEMTNLSIFITKLKMNLPDYCLFLENKIKKKQAVYLAIMILSIIQWTLILIISLYFVILMMGSGSPYY